MEKQQRYSGKSGMDWIDWCEDNFTPEEVRGFYKFTIGKYISRFGRKDDPVREAYKIMDYANRLHEFEVKQLGEEHE
jgi:hypothetical protein